MDLKLGIYVLAGSIGLVCQDVLNAFLRFLALFTKGDHSD